ncbi:MAG: hypothetical protein MUP15_00285 [Dehalococcoidia bacterium]|nr:hypothetical protein [Dehalococcoidia bacterium]
MSRLLWGAVGLLTVTIAVVLVPAGPGGPVPDQALAHIITPTGTPGPPMFHVEIDADAWNGTSPCNPVDTSAEVGIGVPNDIAVCLTSAIVPIQPTPPLPDPNANGVREFGFDVLYDPALNSCVDKNCNKTQPCTEDDMPDLNECTTLGQGVPTNPDIGVDWRCDGFGPTEPSCAGGVATIFCLTQTGPFPPTGPGVAFPLFAVTFTANAVGVDNLTLANVSTYDNPLAPLGSCNPVLFTEPELPCYGATLFVQAPIGGIAEAPLTEADVLADERASSVPNALAFAAVAAGGALLLAAGAWYARTRRRTG